MLDALSIMKASVRKWDRIVAGSGSDGGVLDCPPCRIYYALVCTGCPIAAFTGRRFCKGTPYGAWYHHQVAVHGYMRRRVYCDTCRQLATEMRDFMVAIVNHLCQREAPDTVELIA
ncbi:MAG: hypothetical protein QNJ22_03880 [Desulfosarcinaceae bacterium]|nr:hypothetical protein [Desulfosarcinaceae bacterium]